MILNGLVYRLYSSSLRLSFHAVLGIVGKRTIFRIGAREYDYWIYGERSTIKVCRTLIYNAVCFEHSVIGFLRRMPKFGFQLEAMSHLRWECFLPPTWLDVLYGSKAFEIASRSRDIRPRTSTNDVPRLDLSCLLCALDSLFS